MNNAYCRRCGAKISSSAQFCPLCGYAQVSAPAPQAAPPPPAVVVVKQSNTGVFWIIFSLLAIFTPLGCLVFPALLVGGGVAALAGIALLPLAIIATPAFIGVLVGAKLWRDSVTTSNKKNLALISMGVGCLLSLILFFTMFPTRAPRLPAPVQATPTPEKRPYIGWFNIDEFGNHYDENEISAKTKLGGKRIAIRGQVGTISGDTASGSLTLKGFKSMTEITCEFNQRTTPQLVNVRPGQVVDVIGDFDGGKSQPFGTDKLTLTDCTFPPTTDALIKQGVGVSSLPSAAGQTSTQQASPKTSVELMEVRAMPFKSPTNGRNYTMLLVDWKNTGSTIVRGVIASIDIFDSAGNRLACSSSRQWVYADSKGISPGGNYREPAGEGFNIIPSPTESSQPARWKVTILEALEKE